MGHFYPCKAPLVGGLGVVCISSELYSWIPSCQRYGNGTQLNILCEILYRSLCNGQALNPTCLDHKSNITQGHSQVDRGHIPNRGLSRFFMEKTGLVGMYGLKYGAMALQSSIEWNFYWEKNWILLATASNMPKIWTPLWATTKKRKKSSTFFQKKVHPHSFCGPQYKFCSWLRA